MQDAANISSFPVPSGTNMQLGGALLSSMLRREVGQTGEHIQLSSGTSVYLHLTVSDW